MRHPDGEIPFFNDAAFGIAPAPGAVDDYADRLGFAAGPKPGDLSDLSASGYARLARGDAVLLLDAAPVGPDYLPAHAHADTLSFELSLFGRRVIVNSGTSVYGGGPERRRQRGTAAHSTVAIEGTDSSEVWGRISRRAASTHPGAPHLRRRCDTACDSRSRRLQAFAGTAVAPARMAPSSGRSDDPRSHQRRRQQNRLCLVSSSSGHHRVANCRWTVQALVHGNGIGKRFCNPRHSTGCRRGRHEFAVSSTLRHGRACERCPLVGTGRPAIWSSKPVCIGSDSYG